jgi:hypothetical protein
MATGIPTPSHIQTILTGLRTAIASVKSWSPEEMEAKLTEACSFLKSSDGENIPEAIHHFREEFSKLLEEAKIKQLVVLIGVNP